MSKYIVSNDIDISGNVNIDNTDDTDAISGGALIVDGGLSVAKKLNVVSTITGASGSSFGNLTLSDGSITDSSGSISFGDENLSTTGTINTTSGYKTADNRTVQPVDFTTGTINYFFGSFNNNNTSPYADCINFNTYYDSSGGNSNMIALSKSSIAMRIYNGTFNASSNYSNYKDVVLSDSSGNVTISGTTGNTTYSGLQAFTCSGGGKFAKDLFVQDGYSLVVGDGHSTGNERLRIHHYSDTNSYIDYGTGNLNIRSNTGVNVMILESSGNITASNNLTVDGTFTNSSDSRIKTNITEIPDNLSLNILRNIECKYYNYIDTQKKGNHQVIGFIAQQVKEHLPIAVNEKTSIIPNEIRIIDSPIWNEITITEESNVEETKYKLTISDLNETVLTIYQFNVGTDENNTQQLEISNIEGDFNSFIFDKQYNYVYLYGKQVDDFHYLNKNALFTTAFSALQEVDKIQQEEISKVAELEAKVATLETQNANLQQQLNDLITQLQNNGTI